MTFRELMAIMSVPNYRIDYPIGDTKLTGHVYIEDEDVEEMEAALEMFGDRQVRLLSQTDYTLGIAVDGAPRQIDGEEEETCG